MNKKKLIRITTIPLSLKLLLKGQLKFMSENGFEVIGISGAGEALESVAQQEQVKTIAVEMTRTISPLKDIKSVWKLYRIFRKEKPLIVHTHTPKAGTVGMLAAWLARVPHRLHTVAGMPLLVAKGKKRMVLDFIEKRTYGWATMVYPNSYGLYDIILQHKYTTKAKLKVIAKGSSNGIDISHFDPSLISEEQKSQLRESLGIKPSDFVYVFVGRMVKDKGINELVRAFDLISEENKNTKLLLVGPLEEELDPLLPETILSIEKNPDIIYVGGQKDVRPYFAISDCLAFPSYREGFPNVVLQAGAMELPSIVSDINGCNEIIVDGQNGLIVPVKDVQKLQDSMTRIRKNGTLLQSLKLESRKMIESRYQQSLIWAELLKEYNSILSTRKN